MTAHLTHAEAPVPNRPVTEQTPVEIDTQLAALYERADRLSFSFAATTDRVFTIAGMRRLGEPVDSRDSRPAGTLEEALAAVTGYAEQQAFTEYSKPAQAQRVLAELAKVREEMAAVTAAKEPLEEEYRRRGGWSRAFLVLNTNGHVHSSMDCPTCFQTTRFGWLPALSGHTEDEIVNAAGSDACTTCYPTAPVDKLGQRTVLHHTEEQAQREREQRQAERAERAAAKASKAIANPDGTPLRSWRGTINTVTTAWQTLVDNVTSQVFLDDPARYSAENARIVAALAHKLGQTEDEVRAVVLEKATVKLKRKGRADLVTRLEI